MARKDPSWAELLGAGLAHLQNGVDHVAEWGFSKMKALDRPEKRDASPRRAVRMVKSAGRRGIAFIGALGDAYYKKYEKLKGRHGKTDDGEA